MPAAEAARRHRHRMPAGSTDPGKDAALIVDGVSGKVLYSRNAKVERHPASLTKLMTAYLLFEALKQGRIKMTDILTFSHQAARQKPTNMNVRAGATITVAEAIDALIVRSANDVAVAIAERLAGTEKNFARLMNAKARQLGMRGSFFRNASGLPDRLQLTTATDMALLARHVAFDFPEHYHFFAKRDFVYNGTRYAGHNRLLGRYKGADGMKTGYTVASGFNLVSSVSRGNVHVIGVVMGGRTARRRDREMIRLLDQTFDAIESKPTLVAHAALPWQVLGGDSPQGGVMTASLSLKPPPVMPTPRPPVVGDPEDEDVAESRSDPEDDAGPIPAPEPTNHPGPAVAAYHPRAQAKPVPHPGPNLSMNIHDWTIQIGAYSDFGQAQAMLASYAERSMDVLGQARRIVIPFQSLDGQWLYRARFGPFLEREARQICARLTERGQNCFAAVSTH